MILTIILISIVVNVIDLIVYMSIPTYIYSKTPTLVRLCPFWPEYYYFKKYISSRGQAKATCVCSWRGTVNELKPEHVVIEDIHWTYSSCPKCNNTIVTCEDKHEDT